MPFTGQGSSAELLPEERLFQHGPSREVPNRSNE